MVNSYDLNRYFNGNTISADVAARQAAAATLSHLPSLSRLPALSWQQAASVIQPCQRFLQDSASTAATRLQTLSSYSIRSLSELNNRYNPMNLLLCSRCSYIRQPSRWLKQELDNALLYYLKKPRRFARLLMSLGVMVPPESLIALTLEETADRLETFTGQDDMSMGKWLNKKADKAKARLLLTLITAPCHEIDRVCQSINSQVATLFNVSSAHQLYQILRQNELIQHLPWFGQAVPCQKQAGMVESAATTTGHQTG